MELKKFRQIFFRLRYFPLHPQWLIYYKETRDLIQICKKLRGSVLDIGCADQKLRRLLPTDCGYVGLDYYQTAAGWYGTRPQIFGDAQCLPILTNSIDSVLLLDVLEHLPRPEDCINEIRRVLKPGGKLILQVPFVYPIHDAPLDFQRWTIYGLRELAKQSHFVVDEEVPLGNPLESAALLTNIAITKTILNWINRKNPLALSLILLPLVVFFINALAWALTKITPQDAFMPSGYRMLWLKR
jgi:SAM-dependent methyltransferase